MYWALAGRGQHPARRLFVILLGRRAAGQQQGETVLRPCMAARRRRAIPGQRGTAIARHASPFTECATESELRAHIALLGGQFQEHGGGAFIATDAEAALQIEGEEVTAAGATRQGRAVQPLDGCRPILDLHEASTLVTPAKQGLGFGVTAMGRALQSGIHVCFMLARIDPPEQQASSA